MRADLPRRLAAEALGALFLLAAVVGSGIMAEQLSGGNSAVALLANTFATSGILVILILSLGPLSAHFNPAVSLIMSIRRELPWRELPVYVVVQWRRSSRNAPLLPPAKDFPYQPLHLGERE